MRARLVRPLPAFLLLLGFCLLVAA